MWDTELESALRAEFLDFSDAALAQRAFDAPGLVAVPELLRLLSAWAPEDRRDFLEWYLPRGRRAAHLHGLEKTYAWDAGISLTD